jgi:molybdate transport system permease protein
MDWAALALSLKLGGATVAILLPVGLLVARWLAYGRFRGKAVVEALLALPLVLPPTVLGFYLLVAFGADTPLSRLWTSLFGHSLVFSFSGLLLASVIANLPFAIQPMQRGFEAVATEVREAAQLCGARPWRAVWSIELPIAWPGIATGLVLTFAHTLGEFGVVLMVGGSIPGETRTIAISIYDRVQAFDTAAAGQMALLLLGLSSAAMATVYALTNRAGRWR